VRAAVRAWVLVVVPLLVLELLMVLIHLPRILATSWDSANHLGGETGRAFGHGRPLDGVSDAAQIAVLAMPITGLLLMIVQLFRKVAVWSWRITRNRPIRRLAALVTLGAAATLVALSWIPTHNYQPIGPGERGTEGQELHALFSLVCGPGPLYSQQAARQHTTHTPTHPPAETPDRPPAPSPPTSAHPSPASATTAPATSPGLTPPPAHAPVSLPVGHPAQGDHPDRQRASHAARHPPGRHRALHNRALHNRALDTAHPTRPNRQHAIE
jgi:putative peptide zinc metalloprotease protein